MSRRNKKKIGNPNPPRSTGWIEGRKSSNTKARTLTKIEIQGKLCTVYPIGTAKRFYKLDKGAQV